MATDTAGVADALRELCRDVRQDEPLRRHVSFRIGGPADVLVTPRTMKELRGVVLKIGKGVDRVRIEGETVVAESGTGLPALAKLTAAGGLAGLEFSAGIPASVGGGRGVDRRGPRR